jgi:MerR family transcriptional regulator, light-induced transcriptional regulator
MQEVGFFQTSCASEAGRVGRASEAPDADLTSSDVEWRRALARVVAAQIVPRLALAHPMPRESRAPRPENAAPEHLSDFTRLLLSFDTTGALSCIRDLQRQGLSTQTIFLDLLAPAARRLGALWESDELDFVAVTFGIGRLHKLMLIIDSERQTELAPRVDRSAILLPTPGDGHSFAAAMVETFFRAAGWRAPVVSASDPLMALATQWIDIIGFSLSNERYLDNLRAAVAQARLTSKNPSLFVLVGGRPFVENPDRVQSVGADGTAPDAPGAVDVARRLLERGRIV